MSFGAGKIADCAGEIPDGGVIAEASGRDGDMAQIGVAPVAPGREPGAMLIAALPPERSDGPTPNGGAYALAYYSKAGGPALRGDADAVEIVEYTADGREIFRT